MRSYRYSFESTIESIQYGRMFYRGVFLPDTLLTELPEARKVGFRLVGEVGGVMGEFGLMAVKTRRYVVLAKGFLAQAKLKQGDAVTFRFSPIDPNHIEVPPELQQALDFNPTVARLWKKLTTGRKRESAFRIASAATEATRHKRIARLLEELIDS